MQTLNYYLDLGGGGTNITMHGISYLPLETGIALNYDFLLRFKEITHLIFHFYLPLKRFVTFKLLTLTDILVNLFSPYKVFI